MLMSLLSLGVCALFLFVVVVAALDSKSIGSKYGADFLIIAGLCIVFFVYRCWSAA